MNKQAQTPTTGEPAPQQTAAQSGSQDAALAAMAESEARLRQIASLLHEAVWLRDTRTLEVLYVNPAYETIWGRSCESLYAQPMSFLDALHPDDRERVMQAFQNQSEGAWFDQEFRIIRPDGSFRWVWGRTFPIKDEGGQVYRVVAVTEDITARKQAEQQLRFQAMLLDQIQDSIIATDLEGQITYTNKVATRLLQVGWTELIGQSAHALGEDAGRGATQQEIIDRTLADGKWQGIVVNYASDGSEKLIEARTWLIRDQSQQPVGMVGVSLDVTERVRMEEALHQRALELQERNEELDAFAHTVAHDLKSPLGPLLGYANMLGSHRGSMPDEDVEKCCAEIARSAHRLGNIVDELLLLAELRRAEVVLTPLDMGTIVLGARQRLADKIVALDAQIALPDEWPQALGYAAWVEEVWANYLSNALKYSNHPPQLALGATPAPEGMLRFWVRDNGDGISPEDQPRLFTPFTRLNQVRARGQGLGLSIVRRIVEKLGGQVGVESEGQPGQGSTFSFTLPAAPSNG
ncbi:MAG: PAS domain S-box protein [Thermoflexales bacterium]|nr:PAS domain S-box protein [Thermoflexales bacterium]